MRAVALLSWWQLRNSLRTLLSDPRKLILVLFFLLSLGCGVGSVLFGISGNAERAQFLPTVDPNLIDSILRLSLILLAFGVIDTGLGDGLLAFAPSDVDYLFPSPIGRRTVLAYRLPRLTFGSFTSGAMLYFLFRTVTALMRPPDSGMRGSGPSSLECILGMALCVGIYLNLAMLVAVRFLDRGWYRRCLLMIAVLFGLWAGGSYLRQGSSGFVKAMHQPALSAVLYPSTATADLMGAQFDNRPGGAAILWLSALYLASVALLFAKEFNFYEQSIASTTRMAAFRSAAKGGYASLMAQRASTLKRKSARTYSVPPFGQGAVAVFWGHLSAAARRPWVNFIMPTAGGLAEGIFGGLSARTSPTIAISAMAGLALYVSIGFLGAAKTASEAAIRRRELLAPLPIPGWQMVVANLGIPISAAACFGLGAAIGYTAMGGPHWPLLVLGLVVLYPLRLSDRMAIQYLIVLGFPDLADKIQQLVGQSVTYLAFIPCILLEVIACIPAILLRSPLIALCSLIAVQLPLLFFSLWVGGRASERAIATGEPVRLSKLFAS